MVFAGQWVLPARYDFKLQIDDLESSLLFAQGPL
jgi:hypothetical protein